MEEIWKTVPGYEGLYEVSNFGGVRSLPRMGYAKNGARTRPLTGGLLKQSNGTFGRKQIRLCKEKKAKNARVHQLVMLTFVGPCPQGMEVCHNDGDASNNRLDNLRYDTPLSNHADKKRHGTTAKGEGNKASKLDAEKVKQIRQKFAEGQKGSAIAREYAVSHALICMIVQRKIWTHI